MKKRLMAILLIALAAAGIFAIGKSGMPVKEKEQSEDSSLFSNHNKDSIYLWYTDDALTTYLSSAAVAYNDMMPGLYRCWNRDLIMWRQSTGIRWNPMCRICM